MWLVRTSLAVSNGVTMNLKGTSVGGDCDEVGLRLMPVLLRFFLLCVCTTLCLENICRDHGDVHAGVLFFSFVFHFKSAPIALLPSTPTRGHTRRVLLREALYPSRRALPSILNARRVQRSLPSVHTRTTIELSTLARNGSERKTRFASNARLRRGSNPSPWPLVSEWPLYFQTD